MNKQEISILAALKTSSAYGVKYTADMPPAAIAQFAIITDASTKLGDLGGQQVSGADQKHSGVLSKAVCRHLLHDDELAINRCAHSMALMGVDGIAGKFLMPHNNGDQALLNSARAFATDAVPFSAQMIELGLPTDFIKHLEADITNFETAISAKGAGVGTESGATGGLADLAHKAVIAMHIVDTVVRNVYKNDAEKLAEWVTASHVERHTPVPRTKTTTTTPTA